MRPIRYVLLSLCLVVLPACGDGSRRPPGMPKLVPLALTLTQEGVPLAGAFVTFYPEAADSQWSAGGMSNDRGIVALQTRGEFPGVAPGTYKITVKKTELTESTFQADPDGDPELFNRSESMRKGFSLVDPVYGEPSTTTLEMTVAPGRSAETLELGKAMRIPIPIK